MTAGHVRHDARGFTILEMLVSMAIMVGITGVIFALLDPARGTYRTQPEVSDMQQRLRVGASFLRDDLLMAGAGSQAGGSLTGTLTNFFAAVQPNRVGGPDSDPPNGVFYRTNTITVFYIPPNAPQATIAESMPQTSAELKIGPDRSSCPPATPLCNWKVGSRVLIFDEEGAFDTMTITQVQPGAGGQGVAGMLQHNKSVAGNDLSKRYQAEPPAQVAQVMQRTYYWNPDTLELRYFDGADADQAIVDNVVDVQFRYYGDPRPPLLLPDGRTTSYGPRPPALGTQMRGGGNNRAPGWPEGENCVFRVDPLNGANRIARIPDLAPGSPALVELTEDMLTDGPWCPDATFPTRFDADLLRLRKIGIQMRVQVASAELRGPAGVLFRTAGSGTNSRTLVPDQEVQFDISPRNFNLGR